MGPEQLPYIRTMVLGSICVDTAFVVFSYKNLKKNLWEINPFSNPLLVASSLVVFLAFAGAIYLPFLQILLQTVGLSPADWLLLVGIALFNVSLVELTKWFFIARHH